MRQRAKCLTQAKRRHAAERDAKAATQAALRPQSVLSTNTAFVWKEKGLTQRLGAVVADAARTIPVDVRKMNLPGGAMSPNSDRSHGRKQITQGSTAFVTAV